MNTNKSNGQLTAQVAMSDHKKSGFDLSNNVLGTGKIGRIIPTRALHVMPGDTIKSDSKVAVQFEPLAVPILANMEVKQEHFYVPYNVVWKNWDKFISGGEKMDYNGVVPNVSIMSCVEAFNQLFQNVKVELGEYDLSDDPNKSGLTAYGITNQIKFWNLEAIGEGAAPTFHNDIDLIGEQYEIKDLLKPQHEALSQIYANYSSYEPWFFVQTSGGSASATIALLERQAKIWKVNEVKEYRALLAQFYAMAEDSGNLVIPTAHGFAQLRNYYDFYKSFVGIGSNLDYLNMGRITYLDFVYAIIRDLSAIYNDNGDLDGVQFNLDSAYCSDTPLSVLNLRSNYNIWYNNYRDILLEANAFEPVDMDEVTNEELAMLLVPRQRCWEKDAFTTSLDNPGTGNVSVPTSLMGLPSSLPYIAEPYFITNPVSITGYSKDATIQENNNGGIQYVPNKDMNGIAEITIDGDKYKVPNSYLTGLSPSVSIGESNPTDGSVDYAFSSFSLYALDAAQRAQKWLQKALFFGNRISDFYYMRFGVRFLDARLRLPELLTSSSELVKLDVIMNNTNITTEANGEVYQSIAGDRAAYASAYDNGNSFDRFCEEHGVVMSYLTIMPQVTYAYGVNRDYSRLDQFDFAFSEFATLGMDAVYDTEITALPMNILGENGAKVFGYQGKYYDYKAKHSEEHGELLDTQDMYTFARKFNMYDPNGRPKLNYEFVHCFPDLDMFVVNSTLNDYFRYDIRHSTACERNLPSQSLYI